MFDVTPLFILFQYIVPQHLLSRLVGKLAECRTPWFKNAIIKRFIDQYQVNMEEAAEPDHECYENFNAFFTRPLREGARDICEEGIASPADGAVSQLGDIEHGRIFQAKGQSYTSLELLGGDEALAKLFDGGKFATIYLSPKDYHRVHMPISGTLRHGIYVPGDLFSVNNATADNVPRLFSRNERYVAIFDTEFGPMAMVLVGAMIVAGIETVWGGQVAPVTRTIQRTDYPSKIDTQALAKGDEMGRFKLGSTVVLLFGKDAVEWAEHLAHASPLKMGERIA
jgi:phosphatidylserine decarboxylase